MPHNKSAYDFMGNEVQEDLIKSVVAVVLSTFSCLKNSFKVPPPVLHRMNYGCMLSVSAHVDEHICSICALKRQILTAPTTQ